MAATMISRVMATGTTIYHPGREFSYLIEREERLSRRLLVKKEGKIDQLSAFIL
jgi:hypothetical protein